MSKRSLKIAYLVKRYPRLSETFIVNEILAHEAAGVHIDIFALLPPEDTHFQEAISRIRAAVTYLPFERPTAIELWDVLVEAVHADASTIKALTRAKGLQAHLVYQALLLAMHIKRRQISHLHAHFAATTTTVARLAANIADIPYSFTAHARDIFHESVDSFDLNQKIMHAAAVVTVSDFNLKYLQMRNIDAGSRISHINYGIDLDRLPYISPRNRRRTVVAVGRLVEKKGFSVLIEACALLARNGCSFHCQIIGGGLLEASMHTQIEYLALQDYIEMLGARSQYEVFSYIQNASVMVAPCIIAKDGDRDGIPNVLLEAMALGTPCVSTNIVGIPELVIHNKTGLLTEPFDVIGLASAIERLLDDSELRVQLSDAARRLVESAFDIRSNSSQLRRIFANCQGDYMCH